MTLLTVLELHHVQELLHRKVTVSNNPTATVSGGTFCATGTTTLTTTGAVGGTFSATPAGLVIDATTGVIDLGASTPNTYDITYSFGTAPCTGTATSQVTVSAQPTATVSGGTFCNSGTTTLAVTGTTGGTFSVNTSRTCDRCKHRCDRPWSICA
jgi:hypothetical protein